MKFFLFLCSIFLFYPKNTLGSTCSRNACNFLELFGCLRDVSTNNDLTKPHQNHPGPIDCVDVQRQGNSKSGIYRIWPLNWQIVGSFFVRCDLETQGGGWTVFQRRGRYNHSNDYFYRDWFNYSVGFGNLNEDFWLGNERIFSLTNQGKYSLRIDMKDNEGNQRYALYDEFWIENEKQQYRMHTSGYSGDAGDSFITQNDMKFTTKDRDNDVYPQDNCAQMFKGGWWYQKCHTSNLNGFYLDGPHDSFADGVNWYHWKGHHYSLPEVEMKIRR